MSNTAGYNTRARAMILEYLKENVSTTVSAADIVLHLKAQGLEVNRSTVYRYLKKLSQDNTIIKYADSDSEMTVYQYIGDNHHCSDHLHLQCIKCEKIIHLDCRFMDELKKHLLDDHKFRLQCEGSMLRGICDECKEK